MSITATSAATSSSSASNPNAPAAAPSSQQISITNFMQLLSAEMANQDPLQPMDPTQTMTQLAQFTTLQQTNQISENQSLATANSYIGATVTMPGVNGAAPTTGVVTAVDSSAVAGGGSPLLKIGGTAQEYPVTAITQVQLTVAAPAGSSSSSSAAAPANSTGSTTLPPSTNSNVNQ
jgi:flagellar basal-body rod modification protein FlgD